MVTAKQKQSPFGQMMANGSPAVGSRKQATDNGVQPHDRRIACPGSGHPVTLKRMDDSGTSPRCAVNACPTPELCRLSRCRAGTVAIVRQLTAAPEVNQRLREMGFGETQRIKVLQGSANLLCQVCNARLGLSARLADQIWVEPVSPLPWAA